MRLAAWIGLVAAVSILIGAIWVLLANYPCDSLLLPVGIALVNLTRVIPTVRSGRSRHCLVSTAPVTLVKLGHNESGIEDTKEALVCPSGPHRKSHTP